jgi:hypothetical protein
MLTWAYFPKCLEKSDILCSHGKHMCSVNLWNIVQPWRWRFYISLKRGQTSIRLYGETYQNIIFIYLIYLR